MNDTTQFISGRQRVLDARKLAKSAVYDPEMDGKGCHGGNGVIGVGVVFDGNATPSLPIASRHIKFVHDNILPPGSSIGYHQHNAGEEYYYIISGKGLMQLDGEEYEMKEGEISICFAGGYHGIINNSDEDLRLFVFYADTADKEVK